MSYRKSKANPSGLCLICKEKIVNRCKSSWYCLVCERPSRKIKVRVYSLIWRLRKKHPDFDIKHKLTIKRKIGNVPTETLDKGLSNDRDLHSQD